MQNEINTYIANNNDTLNVNILGVNEIGFTNFGNALNSSHSLPLLQEIPQYNVNDSWSVSYRDVWILNEVQEPYAVVNLTTYNLSNPVNYNGLKNLFIGAATGQSCTSVSHPFASSVCK